MLKKMTRFERLFVYSIRLFGFILVLVSFMIWYSTHQFTKAVNELKNLKMAPMEMKVIYQEEKQYK